jgi:hypothetical protein
MATNILALPLVYMQVQTGNNEDWIDSILYQVNPNDDSPTEDWPQLDLRGINFEMEIRRSPEEHQVIISASTKDGTLAIGAPPNFGYLLINVPIHEMKAKFAGKYVGDITATVGEVVRVISQMDLTILEGITKTP